MPLRTSQDCRLALIDALRVQGMVRARQGRWEEADAAFEEGATLARAMEYPHAEARILAEQGLSRAQRGETQQGSEKLQHARTIFARLGAHPYLERTERALSTLP